MKIDSVYRAASRIARLRAKAVAMLFFTLSLATQVQGVVVSLEAPGVQSSSVAGVVTENFNTFSRGDYASLDTSIGTITASNGGRFAIVPADIYGGAGGIDGYFSVGVQSGSAQPALLATGGPRAYFGFWWSAADYWNEISFYSGGREVATFNTAWVLAKISELPDAGGYFGNPNNGSVPWQYYAYINIIFTGGLTFDLISFSNLSATASGFETDNWSIGSVAPVVAPGTIIEGGATAIVPEPASWVAFALATFVGLIALSRPSLRFSTL